MMFKSYWQQIEKVEVERETDSSVWIKGRSHRKISDFESYHHTFDSAKNHLLRRAQNEVDKQKQWLSNAEQNLALVQSLKRTVNPTTERTKNETISQRSK